MRRRILSIRVDSDGGSHGRRNLHRCAFKPALKRPGQGTLRGHRESMDSLPRAPGPAKEAPGPCGHVHSSSCLQLEVSPRPLVLVAKKQNHQGMVPRIHGCHVAIRKRGPGRGLFKGEFVSPLPRTRTPARTPQAPGAGGPLAEAKPKKAPRF
jgi:hypothetical protein